jgi:hypothetical protein
MNSPVCEVKIAVAFDSEGFQAALARYLGSVGGEGYSQEWHDKVTDRAVELAMEFTKFAVEAP